METREHMSEIRCQNIDPRLIHVLCHLKWRLLLPGASEPRLKLLRPQGFRSVFRTALRGQGNRSIVVVGNYESGPIRRNHPEQKHALYALVDPVSPPYGGGAGYCPRVRWVYCDGRLLP